MGVVLHELPIISRKSEEQLELFIVLGSWVCKQCPNFLLARLNLTKANVVI